MKKYGAYTEDIKAMMNRKLVEQLVMLIDKCERGEIVDFQKELTQLAGMRKFADIVANELDTDREDE